MAIPVIFYEKTGCYRLLNLLAKKIVTKEFAFVGRWPLKMTCKSTISMGGLPLFLRTGTACLGNLVNFHRSTIYLH
jgi:hypothetical protein